MKTMAAMKAMVAMKAPMKALKAPMKAMKAAAMKVTKAAAKAKPKKWLALRPDGCSKCRYSPGCTPSCYKQQKVAAP